MTSTQDDLYGLGEDIAVDKVFTVTGQDWDTIVSGLDEETDERIVVNMGPQHPSTHGVLRLVLELEGESVVQTRPVIGYASWCWSCSGSPPTWSGSVPAGWSSAR